MAYIIIVLGLMFYCKKRRKANRRKKQPEGNEPEMECLNGTLLASQGEMSLHGVRIRSSVGKHGSRAIGMRRSEHSKIHFFSFA